MAKTAKKAAPTKAKAASRRIPKKAAKAAHPKKAAPKTAAKKAVPKKASAKKASHKSPEHRAKKVNKLGVKNSLVNNINAKKEAGTSKPKSAKTVSNKSYKEMKRGWK